MKKEISASEGRMKKEMKKDISASEGRMKEEMKKEISASEGRMKKDINKVREVPIALVPRSQSLFPRFATVSVICELF